MKSQFKRLKELGFALKEKHQSGRNFHLTGIFYKSKLISVGFNHYEKSHPQTLNFSYHCNAKLHSELSACLKAGLTDCKGLVIMNLRIDNNNKVNNSMFCKGCRKLIESLNFNKAYYTDKSGNLIQYVY